jgi:uncharacterized protein YtpQ (UPF0354 family)
MGIFKWRGRISKQEFRKQLVEALRADAPQLTYTPSPGDELEFTISGLENGGQSIVALHRAYAEFERDTSERDEILARWKNMLLRQANREPLDPANVVPMIKDRRWLDEQVTQGARSPIEGADDSLWVEEYNEDLLIVYAEHHDGFSYSLREDFAAAGIKPAEIRSLAMRNLRTRTPKREFDIVNGVWMISAGGNFEAALLLDEEIWNNHRFKDEEEIFAAVPERDTLLAGTDNSPTGVWNLATMAAHIHREEPYPVSAHLMVRRSGRFVLLDPQEVDDTHPIPDTSVIDVHGIRQSGGSTMAVVIATPMQADPRSIYRLFRKLDGHLEYIKSAAYREQCGAGDTDIEVSIHGESDAKVFDLFAVLPDFVSRRGARLTVRHTE